MPLETDSVRSRLVNTINFFMLDDFRLVFYYIIVKITY